MKKLFVLGMIVMIIFLAGCKKDQTTSITKEQSPFIGGLKGIVAEFEQAGIIGKTSNVAEVFENEGFPVVMNIKNKGEEDIQPGKAKVTLLGIDLKDFSGIANNGILTNIGTIEKVSDFNKEGGEEALDFTTGADDAKYLVPLTGNNYDVNLFAKIEYDYKTKAVVTKVCFKEDLKDTTVCNVDETKDVFSSAGPIQVKSAVEKRAGQGKVGIEFEVENAGNGDVTRPGTEFDFRYNELKFSTSDPEDWECLSSGRVNEIRFDANDKATVVCKLKNPLAKGSEPFTKQFDLILDYKYKEVVQTTVRIVKP